MSAGMWPTKVTSKRVQDEDFTVLDALVSVSTSDLNADGLAIGDGLFYATGGDG